jgi:hypothetical protein
MHCFFPSSFWREYSELEQLFVLHILIPASILIFRFSKKVFHQADSSYHNFFTLMFCAFVFVVTW